MFRHVIKQEKPGEARARARIKRHLAPSLQTLPLWARLISGAFTVMAAACALSVALIALVVTDHVVRYQDVESLVLLSALGGTAILLALVLTLARHFALVQAPERHHAFSARVELMMAGLVALALAAIHPALALGVLAMALVLTGAVIAEIRFAPPEPDAFGPVEVRHILSGREPDSLLEELKPDGLRLALFGPLTRFAAALSGLVALLIGGWLAADKVITTGAMVTAVLLSAWCTAPMIVFAREMAVAGRRRQLERIAAESSLDEDDEPAGDAEAETDLDLDEDDEVEGLRVTRLAVHDRSTRRELLGPVDIAVPAGSMVGVTGPPGCGKSILLKAITCRHPHPNLKVTGDTRLKGWTLWSGSEWFDAVSVVSMTQSPMLFPGSAMDNLLCFETPDDDEVALRAAKSALGKLDVFGIEAEKLLAASDVTLLSRGQCQMLCLARALILNPDLLVLDVPDGHLPPGMHPAISDALHVAQRGGAAVVVATANRQILETCDEILMMQDGYVVDRGPPEELMGRHGSSWSRIVVKRSMEEEKRLHAWLRSHFKRADDADSLRDARALVSEMMILSCSDLGGEEPDEDETVSFDFRWDKDMCHITMHDDGDPISTARLQQTRDGTLGNKPEDVALREVMDRAGSFEQLRPQGPDGPRRSLRTSLGIVTDRNTSKRRYG